MACNTHLRTRVFNFIRSRGTNAERARLPRRAFIWWALIFYLVASQDGFY